MKNTAVLILAAGKSSRMHSIKQLLKINDKFLLDIVIDKGSKVQNAEVFVVLGANATIIKNSIKSKNCEFIVNKEYNLGLSSSIVTGVNYIEKHHKKIQTILITLADQPEVNQDYLNQLINLSDKNPNTIIATSYGEKIGVPACFPQPFFNNLKGLKGDFGAKQLIQNHLKNSIVVDRKKPFLDIDTPADYAQFLKIKNDYFSR